VWALSRLMPREKFATLAERQTESDASVKDEWAASRIP